MKRKITALHFIAASLSALITLALFGNACSEMLESEEPRRASIQKQRVEKIEARIKELDDKLGLTLEQKIKVKEILTKTKEETSKVLDEVAAKVKKIKDRSDAEIKTVLTKRQKGLLREVPERGGGRRRVTSGLQIK